MPKDKNQLVTSLKVDPELWKEARIEAIKHDLTLAKLVDQAIREWIEKKAKETEK